MWTDLLIRMEETFNFHITVPGGFILGNFVSKHNPGGLCDIHHTPERSDGDTTEIHITPKVPEWMQYRLGGYHSPNGNNQHVSKPT